MHASGSLEFRFHARRCTPCFSFVRRLSIRPFGARRFPPEMTRKVASDEKMVAHHRTSSSEEEAVPASGRQAAEGVGAAAAPRTPDGEAGAAAGPGRR